MTFDFFTRLAGRTLGQVSVVEPDILSIFTITAFHESEKIPSGYQKGLLDVAEDNGIHSSFLSAKPRVNMIDVTCSEPSETNRCKVQDEATASTIGTESKKATSKTRPTSSLYFSSKSGHAESHDRKIPTSKIPTISKSSFPNIMNEKNQYKLPEEESLKCADFRLEGIPVNLRSTGIMASKDILHEDTGSSHLESYSKSEIFTGEQSRSVSSLVADSTSVQEKDKKLLLNCTEISEQRMTKSSKNNNKLLEDKYHRAVRGSPASESSFNENKKEDRYHLAVYSADAENKEITSPLVSEATADMHVAASPLDYEKVNSLREKISENLEDWPVEIDYSTGAQGRETISALDDNSIDSVRKLAQSPIQQEQLIHVNIGRIYVKASLLQGHNEERHKIVKRDPSLSLDEYLKRRSGGSYE